MRADLLCGTAGNGTAQASMEKANVHFRRVEEHIWIP